MINSSLFKKTLISFFILLNILAVLVGSSPPELKKLIKQKLCLTQDVGSRVSFLSRFLSRYGQLAGLSSSWRMFSNLSRENTQIQIKGCYKNGEIVVLLLKQDKENFIDRFFFSFREPKLWHSISYDKRNQERYARFLCRKFSVHSNSSIEKIIFELNRQKILQIKEAVKTGHYLAPTVNKIVNIYNCPVKEI